MRDRAHGHGGPRALGEFTQRLTRTPLARRGFGEAALVAEWPLIVGTAQALGSLPLKIGFAAGARHDGTLHVRVSTGGLATEFRHRAPLILQRINGYFGYNAVSRLRLSLGPVGMRPGPQSPPAAVLLDADQESQLALRLQDVADPALRSALARLGRKLAPNLAGDV
jgi:hypothetical protein